MKKKMLIVLAVVMFCTLAASAKDTLYEFTLRDTGGGAYCNIAFVRNYTPGAPVPKALVGGWYYNALCDGNYYPGGGFKFAVSPYIQYGTGAVLALNSPAYFTYEYVAFQLLVNPTAHTWTIYWDNDNYGNYLVNYGTWVNGTASEVKTNTSKRDAAAR